MYVSEYPPTGLAAAPRSLSRNDCCCPALPRDSITSDEGSAGGFSIGAMSIADLERRLERESLDAPSAPGWLVSAIFGKTLSFVKDEYSGASSKTSCGFGFVSSSSGLKPFEKWRSTSVKRRPWLGYSGSSKSCLSIPISGLFGRNALSSPTFIV